MTTNHIPAASGTPATRADTIEKLVRSKLVERKGRQLHATTEGERLTDVVEPRLKDVLLTARMEQALSDVEHGKRGPSEVMDMFHRRHCESPPTRPRTSRPMPSHEPRTPTRRNGATARAAASR